MRDDARPNVPSASGVPLNLPNAALPRMRAHPLQLASVQRTPHGALKKPARPRNAHGSNARNRRASRHRARQTVAASGAIMPFPRSALHGHMR